MSLIRRDTDHAMRLLLELGDRGESARVPVRALAATAGVPVSLAHKCVQRLRRSGLLDCHRGVAGGILLRRPLAAIAVMDVVTAVQGRPAVCRCTVRESVCSRQEQCRLSRGLAAVQEGLDALLGAMTLADLSELRNNVGARAATRRTVTGRGNGRRAA